jgi:ketosteroid isomerase-like protein
VGQSARARRWLEAMQECVRGGRFEDARELFADDAVAFGTVVPMAVGRQELERRQWRELWARTRDFAFQLDQMHCLALGAGVAVAVRWHSTGLSEDGPFERRGRATVVLAERGGRLVAVHSHFSLDP